MSGVPYIFGTATTSIPLSQLDTDFATPVTIGSTTVALGNTTTTLAGLTGVTSSAITDSGLTSGRVTYAGTGGLLQDSANLTFNGTTLTANTIGAFTLGGTVAGGGNQLNNVIIGASTPLAGSFTTLTSTGVANFQNVSATIGNSSGQGNNGAKLIFNGWNTSGTNWQIDTAVLSSANQLAFTPSTVAGGLTFTTPVVLVSTTGLAVTGALSATGNGTFTGSSVYGGGSYIQIAPSSTDTNSLTVRAAGNITGTISGTDRITVSLTGLAVTGALSATSAKTGAGTTASTATGVPVVLFAPTSGGMYLVWCSYASGNAGNNAATAIVRMNGTDAGLTMLQVGSFITMDSSGGNIRSTQVSGGNQTIDYAYLKIQ